MARKKGPQGGWTIENIVALLERDDRAVERAMMALYKRQTRDEQQADRTKHLNHVGFNALDAAKGGYYARWVLSGRKLSGYHLVRARALSLRYRRQLRDIANQKLAVGIARGLAALIAFARAGSEPAEYAIKVQKEQAA